MCLKFSKMKFVVQLGCLLICILLKVFFGNDPRKNVLFIYCNYCGSDTHFEKNCSKKRDQENNKNLV